MANMDVKGAAAAAPEFVLKDLESDDVFRMTSLIGKLGISNIGSLFDEKTLRATAFEMPTKMGKDGKIIPLPIEEWTEGQRMAAAASADAKKQLILRVVETVLTNFEQCKTDVYRLLASGYSVSVEEIRAESAVTLLQLIDDYINREAFSDFFTQALKLLGHMGSFGSKMSFSGATGQARTRS